MLIALMVRSRRVASAFQSVVYSTAQCRPVKAEDGGERKQPQQVSAAATHERTWFKLSFQVVASHDVPSWSVSIRSVVISN